MDLEELKRVLEEISDFIYADRLVVVDEDNTKSGIKKRLNQLREAAFAMEDVLDDYMIFTEQKDPRPPGCADLSCAIIDLIKGTMLRHQIKCMFEKFHLQFREIRDEIVKETGGQIQSTSEQGSRSGENQHANLETKYMFKDDVVVGFDVPIARLIDLLVHGRKERTVISVVGMGGQGKTTLAKKVFDSKVIIGHFDCRVWITVSQSYTVEGLLRDMLLKLYKQDGKYPSPTIYQMDGILLIHEVRNYLQQKRYVVFFDDVWNAHFWNDFEFAAIDSKNGSKILITTRIMDVVVSCKRSSFIEVLKLQPLSPEKSMELFRMKAFQSDYNGKYSIELENIIYEIVSKCNGLPIALVTIGSSLYGKGKNVLEWKKFSHNLGSELERNPLLSRVTKIFSICYDDLPYYLKRCLLSFAIYPEDYEVKSKRIIRQWIAEGFVNKKTGKTLEEAAEQYLTELIHRGLVQVSSVSINGKVKGCCVHDILRELILIKVDDLSFCNFISEQYQSYGIARRLSIATSSSVSIENIECSHVRSLYFFTEEELPANIVKRIPTKYKLLKVLDFENAISIDVPENLGDLFHLKYLSFRNTEIQSIPKSIGELHNLETLDLRQTDVNELPEEISKLRKLRHLLGNKMSLIHLKGGIGGMESLQTLSEVKIDEDGIELITELGNLTQLRKLSLFDVRKEQEIDLCSSINKMQHLEKLNIETKSNDIPIEFSLVSNPAMLQKLRLQAKINKLPEWIPKLENLFKLSMSYSQLTEDPLESLQNLPNLLALNLAVHSYDGECLHFQQGGFQKLKELGLRYLYNLESIIIEQGALQSLKELTFMNIPNLKTAPSGINYLANLDVLNTHFMPTEFEENIAPFSKLVKDKKL